MTTALPPARFTRRARTTPLGMVLYGTPGVGKTTQAAAFPGAVICRYEDGLGMLDVDATELLTTYPEGVAAINEALALTPGTFVLDSLDWLERAIHAETCRRHGKASIEAFGYGKGYTEAAVVWAEFLDGMTALRRAGWSVVLLAHSQVVRFDAPDTESYDRYSLKLHKHAAALVTEWAEVIGFMHWETSTTDRENGRGSNTRAIGTGHRNIALQETPAYIAKSRYPVPPMLRMDPLGHNLLNALATAGAVFPTITTDAPVAQES
jgi:hypothetical protein